MRFLLNAFIFFALISCEQRKTSSQKAQTDESQDSISAVITETTKYLITEYAVGYFNIGEPWQSIAAEKYTYVYTQGYGMCVDACCDGGYVLGLKMDEAGEFIEDGMLTIGCAQFDDDESETKYKDNSNVFYTSSDNCKAWFWKDKIKYIFIYSDLFKSKRGYVWEQRLKNRKVN